MRENHFFIGKLQTHSTGLKSMISSSTLLLQGEGGTIWARANW